MPQQDESSQLQSLGAICEALTFDSQLAYESLRPDVLLPMLVPLIDCPGEGILASEISLLACRATTQLLEAVPKPASDLCMRLGGGPALVRRLLVIDYMDVAEQAIAALALLTREIPEALFLASSPEAPNGMCAMLVYLEWYPLATQHMALTACSRGCFKASPQHWPRLEEAAPMLVQLVINDHDLASTKLALSVWRNCLESLQRYLVPPSSSSSLTGSGAQPYHLQSLADDALALAESFAQHGLVEALVELVHRRFVPGQSSS